ncbi:alpha/beta hydrolase [Tahibacter amnicola]|uniref:Proline iminopeptidase n=1 Tax=Tahibacter amnicola TaxID=2976241 RepID=A0ABY6BG64_9GAMM|nr:alpha/beta hydrolase [Tahibacter amnicola]UXI68777.1 alpha/beta hydrolase [Tahibacter amnicola]
MRPFDVPEDRATPGGRRLAMKLALIRSTAAEVQDDPVVFLAGGPGQAATQYYADVAEWLGFVRRYRHIVLMDQRGTGASNPLTCEAADNLFATPVTDANLEQYQAQTRDCAKALAGRADPRFYTTTDAVEDLEALRRALGGPRLNLVGVSYGTRVAQQYAMRYPEGVRSLVLDGVVPNELYVGSDNGETYDVALKARFAQCADNPECKARFGDVYASMIEVAAKLRQAPLSITYRDSDSFQIKNTAFDVHAFATLVHLYAFSAETAALLPLLIHDIGAGDAGPAMSQLDMAGKNLVRGMTPGMRMSVLCTEDLLDESRKPGYQSPLTQEDYDHWRGLCSAWPKAEMPADFHQPMRSNVPALLLSGEFDPATPARYAEQVLAGLPRGRHLVAGGQGHNVIGRGCIPKLVGRFIDKLEPETLDAGCIADIGPPPFYLDDNGASP